MANLKPIRPAIRKLCDKLCAADFENEASVKLGYQTTLTVRVPTVSETGFVFAVEHFDTVILRGWLNPAAFAGRPDPLQRLYINNGGFRSQSTFSRLWELIGDVTGGKLGLGRGADPFNGDTLYAADPTDGRTLGPLHREAWVSFDASGAPVELVQGEGRAYPDQNELEALQWLHGLIKTGDERARFLLADVIRTAGEDWEPRWNGKGSPYQTADYIERHGSRDLLFREYAGFRRFNCATRYGDRTTRKALAELVEARAEALADAAREAVPA